MRGAGILTILAVLAFVAGSAAAAQEQHKGMKMSSAKGEVQTVCPVTGKPIDKEVYADHNGKRVYFCCKDCLKEFQKDPEAIIKKMESQGVRLDSTQHHGKMAQTVCPVSGKPIDKEVYADHNGKRVYFCCKDCLKEFQKDPEAIIKKMESEGIKLSEVPSK